MITTDLRGGVQYSGNGATVAFDIPWRVENASYVVVWLIAADGAATKTTATITNVGSPTAVATLAEPPAAGTFVHIVPSVPAVQPVNLRSQGTFDPAVIEGALDRVTLQVQGLEFSSIMDEYAVLTEEGAVIVPDWFNPGGDDASIALAAATAASAAAASASASVSALNADLASTSDATKGGALVGYYDPVAPTFLKTTSDIINGERVSALRGIDKAKHAGIRAQTNTDDLSTNINALLDAMATAKRGELYFPRGRYVSGQILVPGGLTLRSDGATIMSHGTLATGISLLRNKNIGGGAGVRTDSNIVVDGFEFVGSGVDNRTAALVEWIKVSGLTVSNCRVRANRYMGMAFGGCAAVRALNLEVSDFGKAAVTVEGGPALWFAPYGDGTAASDHWVQNPYCHDGEWAGIYFGTVNRLSIINPHMVSVKEAGIFGTASALQILGGQVVGVTKKYISASGVDFGGVDAVIGGGLVIAECDNTGLVLADAQSVLVSGIKTRNMRRDAATYPTGSHIAITSFSASPNQPRDITITGCTAIDYSSPSTAAVRLEGQAPGGLVPDVLIANNNFAGTSWTSNKAVYLDQSYVGSNVSHRGNLGNDDTAGGALATRSTTQTLTTGTFAAIEFDAADTVNTRGPTGANFMWTGTNPSRITCYEAGRVSISGQVCFTGNATGIRAVEVRKNGSASGAAAMPKAKANNIGVAYAQQVNVASTVLNVAAGDYFELFAMQDSGADLTTEPGISQTWFSVRYVQ